MNLFAYSGVNWPFIGLEPETYSMLMCDPPWDFSNWSEKGERKNAKHHYRCLPLDQIQAFPIGDLATEDAVLWLWATNPMLDVQIGVMRRWGFKFKTAGTWIKTTKNGKLAFGTGYILRCASEPFLIGTRGKPKTAKNVRSAFMGLARRHSEKPEEGFREAERLLPSARRVEIFSRTNRPGWESWGDEVGKFGVAA